MQSPPPPTPPTPPTGSQLPYLTPPPPSSAPHHAESLLSPQKKKIKKKKRTDAAETSDRMTEIQRANAHLEIVYDSARSKTYTEEEAAATPARAPPVKYTRRTHQLPTS